MKRCTFRGAEELMHLDYVYPCQRFSSGNTLEDYNP
jgi:hypothetical protein